MSHANSFVSLVEAIFEKSYPPESRPSLVNRLSEFDNKVFNVVSKELEESGEKYRPKGPEIVAMCSKAQADLFPKVATREETPVQSRRQFEMASVIRKMMFSNKFTRQQILDKIREADGVKPRTGWMECGTNLERSYKESNLPLDEPPANFGGLS